MKNLLFVVLLVLLAAPGYTGAQPAVSIPFHTVNGMILLDATVNGKPAVLLLDTGANNSIVSQQAAGLATVQLRALQANQGSTGSSGDAVPRTIDLRLADRAWPFRRVLVMDLTDTSKRLGTRIDGFVGQDVLREFSSVRINYKTRTIELEE